MYYGGGRGSMRGVKGGNDFNLKTWRHGDMNPAPNFSSPHLLTYSSPPQL